MKHRHSESRYFRVPKCDNSQPKAGVRPCRRPSSFVSLGMYAPAGPSPAHHSIIPHVISHLPSSQRRPTRIRTDRTSRGRRPCSSIPDPPDGLRYAPSLEGGPLDGGRTDTQPSRPDTYRPDGTTEGGSSREPLRTAGANLCVPSPICARCRRHSGGASSYFAVTGKRASSLHVPRPRADQTITAAARNSNPPQNTPPARPAPTTAERQQSIPTAQAQARGRPTNPHCSFISRPSRGTKKCRPPSRSVLV